VNDAHTAFHLCLGRETLASLTGDLEVGLFQVIVTCHTFLVVEGYG
jgi:hypothetical protein